ncbi:hypothetical protein [Jiangella asiatica]|uniref:Uncharacterized protein n=1 Tax=Jiangella asiatica TaxID=2530372 RepID=A0A4V6PFB9_9ACTN|nr:hypothetical protein [Jiangella asiatica]TDD98907.1 hypothetical protein E1269_28295 [Jiangella asiatica]
MLIVAVVAFSVAWWLGLYLIARDVTDAAMRRAGLGLLAYALALAFAPFDGSFADAAGYVLAGLPVLIWTGVLLALLPPDHRWRSAAELGWRWVVLPLGTAELVAAAVVGGSWEPLTAVLVLAPLVAALVVLLREHGLGGDLRRGAVVLVSVLFALGAAALLMSLDLLPTGLVLAGVGLDLAVLGVVVAVSNALDAGEAVAADLRRSAVGAGIAVVVFGGQVGLVAVGADDADALRPLAFGVVGAAIAVVTLASPLQALVDRLVFTGRPELRAERSDLRDAADALPRRDEHPRIADLDDDGFTRLVRDALRNYGDLGKLVSSPLIGLPAVDKRLQRRDHADHALERAVELKAMLLESIERLRPRDQEFGTSEEWRYYNQLLRLCHSSGYGWQEGSALSEAVARPDR